MRLTIQTAEDRAQAAIVALKRGDARVARSLLEEITSSEHATSDLWLVQAQACKLDGDKTAEGAALDKILSKDPRNINALLMKGDWFGRNGDRRAAAAHYRTALTVASNAGPLPPQTNAALRQAQKLYGDLNREFEEHLERSVSKRGSSPAAISTRVREALDILCEKKQVYFQEPSAFYFPGLPQIQFYERSQFPWLAKLEAATPAIREELLAILQRDGAFTPYIEAEPNRPPTLHEMLGDPGWSAFHMFRSGELVAENAELCPATLAAISDAPIPLIRGRSPMALFSLLRPGTHIKPHNGMLNSRLICHLPLIVPPGCGIRVGNETREWKEGEAMIFDDSIEHEAWNRGEGLRVVLLFEIWRPEISEEERLELTSIFEAITDY